MRITHLALVCLLLVTAPISSWAAGGGVSVRAIAFIASHQSGKTDQRLAPYEGVLRSNLRFESFRYAGESSTSVSTGGTASLSVPGSGTVQIHAETAGRVKVEHDGTVVTVSRGRPAVFMGGPAGQGEVSGIIVMTD